MHFRWSRLIWLIALSTGLWLLIFGLFLAQTLFSERESISWVLLQEHVYWSSSQSNVESLRFRDALHRFVAGDAAIDGSKLMLRFDILWSRIHLFDEGFPAQRLTQVPDGQARHLVLVELLHSIDAVLPGVLDGKSTDRIMTLTNELVSITHRLSVDINHYEMSGLTVLHEQFQTDIWIMGIMAALIAVGATVVAVLVIRLSRVRRERFLSEAINLLDVAAAPILATDSAGQVLHWNRAIMAATGIEFTQARGARLESLLDRPTTVERAKRLLASAVLGDKTAAAVLSFLSPDGVTVDIEFGVAALADDFGRPVILLIGQDLSARERHRKQIDQMRHLVGLGSVASTLAHELKQPINAVRLAAENGLSRIEANPADTDSIKQKFERIGRLTGRTSAILEHIAHFNAGVGTETIELDIRDVLNRAIDSFADELAMLGIDFHVTNEPTSCRTNGHEGQLERIVVNLISNARDALTLSGTSGGMITLRSGSTSRGTLFIEVEDNGPGIPEETRSQVFDAFFTTKTLGVGTGLGLALSRTLAEAHGGTLEFRTAQPHGTIMKLELPVRNEPPAPVAGTVDDFF